MPLTVTGKPSIETPKAVPIQYLWYTLSPQHVRDLLTLGDLKDHILFWITNYGAGGTFLSVSYENSDTGVVIRVTCTFWPLDLSQRFADFGVAEMQLAKIIHEAIRATLASVDTQVTIEGEKGSFFIGVTDDELLPAQATFRPMGITTPKPDGLDQHTLLLPYKIAGRESETLFAYRDGGQVFLYEG